MIFLRNKKNNLPALFQGFTLSNFDAAKNFGNKKTADISQMGFTLIELMVVIGIMGLLAGAFVLNIAGQRAKRDVAIAANEMVTNIRQAQSYALYSHGLSSGQTVQYYDLKFDLTKPTQYTLQAMYNVSSSPKLEDVQVFNLPVNIQISSIDITQRPAAPTIQTIPAGTGCALIAFASPFGKTFFNSGCAPASFTPSPYSIVSGDDYKKILNFVSNISCSYDAVNCTISAGSAMVIVITDKANTVSKTVTVNGITGAVLSN